MPERNRLLRVELNICPPNCFRRDRIVSLICIEHSTELTTTSFTHRLHHYENLWRLCKFLH